MTWNSDVVQYRSIPFSFKPTTGAGLDDFLLGVRSLRVTAANQFLGNGLNRFNYTKGLDTILLISWSIVYFPETFNLK